MDTFINLQKGVWCNVEKITAMPEASAKISGDNRHPEIKGRIEFYGVYGGTVVVAEVSGLTESETGQEQGFYGFHIHEGGSCTGKQSDSFANVGGHYNPDHKSHPKHTGDLPPLLSDAGEAWMSVYTSRFFPEDVIGKTVVIHDRPDDFHTQPSGASGEKIACGEIVAEDETD